MSFKLVIKNCVFKSNGLFTETVILMTTSSCKWVGPRVLSVTIF